ncbi:GTP 3',8-cyclase MoaA [Clostridium polynesiense]|uniref:GTP 3',8-cyclase MoaA n=1 Tax=Clostridium polynesiense TaxID=1325933 RepID=UPI000590671A|nr:GTP 3',8-cyclase MoaA [Clostridium polynesiense]
MKDKYGRNIDYLRVSLTDRCNLRCIYCMPKEGVNLLRHEDVLRFNEVIKIVKAFSYLGIKKVRYTGGEPLILKGIEELIFETRKISSIKDISITTNGLLLYELADDLKNAGLNRVNISLDTLKPDRYKEITRGGEINKVFKAIEKALKIGLAPLKLNVVLVKGINDDEIKDFIYLTKEFPIEIRFIELMPIGEGKEYFKRGYIKSQDILEEFPELKPIDHNNKIADMYKINGGRGAVGFISPLSCKFCETCNRMRLTSIGTIKPCLHSQEEISIKEFMYDEEQLIRVIRAAVINKPLEHLLNSDGISKSKRQMYQIGG